MSAGTTVVYRLPDPDRTVATRADVPDSSRNDLQPYATISVYSMAR